jgi:hypothetical protein
MTCKIGFLKIRNSNYLEKKTSDPLGTCLLSSGLQKYRKKESVIEILIIYLAAYLLTTKNPFLVRIEKQQLIVTFYTINK